MKKKKIDLSEEEEIKNTLKLLDKDYFQVWTEFEEGHLTNWKVYYRNGLKEYFSIEDRPLLEASKNNISDLYQLLQDFAESKKKAQENIYYEVFEIQDIGFNLHLFINSFSTSYSFVIAIVLLILAITLLLFGKTVGIENEIIRTAAIVTLFWIIVFQILINRFCKKTNEKIDSVIDEDLLNILLKNELKYRKERTFEPFPKKTKKVNSNKQ